MKTFLITLGCAALISGMIYYYRDNKKVKKLADTISDKTHNLLHNVDWNKVAKQAAGAVESVAKQV